MSAVICAPALSFVVVSCNNCKRRWVFSMRSSVSASLCQLFSLFRNANIYILAWASERICGRARVTVLLSCMCSVCVWLNVKLKTRKQKTKQKNSLALANVCDSCRCCIAMDKNCTMCTNNMESNMSEMFTTLSLEKRKRNDKNVMVSFALFAQAQEHCCCARSWIIYNQFRRRIHYRTQTLFAK